jgi:DNA-binding HxlR family transcriptional regulator
MRSTCPISCALDLLGDQWSLIVLRDVVLLNRRRFSEIAQNEGIATNILSDRLSKLEQSGFIRRVANPQDRRGKLVEPTEKSLDLIPMLLELVLFGTDHCGGSAVDDAFLERARNDRSKFISELRLGAAAPSTSA